MRFKLFCFNSVSHVHPLIPSCTEMEMHSLCVSYKVQRHTVMTQTVFKCESVKDFSMTRVIFDQASNECVMYVSCMYYECIRNVL